ncbi:MAG: hypothetical protein NTW19_01570 [Planctomycetota bacterium]|nr:hypothetical protein [Planctomycetota bacterium]
MTPSPDSQPDLLQTWRRHPIRSLAIFLGLMLAWEIGGNIAWSFLITDVAYHCTDNVGFDFLTPGSWVHPNAGDTFAPGWSQGKVWTLWFAAQAAGLLLALVATELLQILGSSEPPLA